MVDKDLLSIQEARSLVRAARAAQAEYSQLGQERIDAVIKAISEVGIAHAEELAQLAQQMEDAGRRSAYRRVMDAVSYFDMGNATLAALLDELADLLYAFGTNAAAISFGLRTDPLEHTLRHGIIRAMLGTDDEAFAVAGQDEDIVVIKTGTDIGIHNGGIVITVF